MRHTPCAQHIPVGSDYWLTMAPFTSGLTQALTRIPFGAVWFSSSQWRRWLEPFLVPCCFALLTVLTRSSSGFSSKASIIRIGSWHGPSAAQARVPLGWAEQSLGLIFFFFFPKCVRLNSQTPQVYLGFSEVCIIIIFSNPLSSWLPHWWLPCSVNRLPLSYIVLSQLLINQCMASTLQLSVLHLPRKASSSRGRGFRSCWML